MVGDAVGIERKDGFDYARPYWQKHGIADYAEATNFTKHPNGKESVQEFAERIWAYRKKVLSDAD